MISSESKAIKVYYTVTQADVDNKEKIANSVTAKTEGGKEGSDEDNTIETDKTESIKVEKVATETGKKVKAGDVVEYTIKVTNTGSITAKGIEVKEGTI